jgi:transcriptional regulator with XRE-family HTH domain
MARQSYVMNTKEFEKLLVDRDIKTNIELAARCNIDRNTAGKIRKGIEQPSSSVMYKLVDGLNIPAELAGRIFFTRYLRNA